MMTAKLQSELKACSFRECTRGSWACGIALSLSGIFETHVREVGRPVKMQSSARSFQARESQRICPECIKDGSSRSSTFPWWIDRADLLACWSMRPEAPCDDFENKH
jgi:hypothetical protein